MLAYLSYEPLLRIRLGPLAVSPHGLGIAIGFLAGARLMMPTALRMGISADLLYAMLTRAAIGAVVGARVAYVLNHAGDYNSILEVFEVWEGGISLLGGIFGAVLFVVPKMRSERLSFWKVMDAAAPGLALGIFVGRVGDLVIADHLGKPTSFFLGYRCPSVPTGSPCEPGTVVHQTALYDFLFAGLLLVLLLRLRRTERYDGFLILVFAACYGAMRVLEDFLREDVRHFGLTGSQITAAITCLLCLNVLVLRRRTPSWGRWDEAPPVPSGPPEQPPVDRRDGDGESPASLQGRRGSSEPEIESTSEREEKRW